MLLISIVIPTYNRAHVLPRAIDSVVAQTYPHWELLIVDDGSSDGTEELVAEYMRKEPRIKFFRRPEDRLRGGNACRNIGGENANGDYVTYLDSDDYYLNSRLMECYKFLEKNRVNCLISGRKTSFLGFVEEGKSRPFKLNESAIDYLISSETLTGTSCYVISKTVLNEVDWDENLLRNQDWDFFIQVSKKYTWEYLDNYDVVIVREEARKRYMHIPSCIKIYEKNKDNILNIKDANRYLRVMMEYCSKYYINIRYVSDYYRLLKENQYVFTSRDKFQVMFPYIFFFLYKVKRLGVDPIFNILNSKRS